MPSIRLFSYKPLLAVLLVAVIARLAFLIAFAPTLDFLREGNAIHGSEAYDAYAQNLLATGIYGRVAGVPDAQIPPLYSYVLAGVYALFGRGFVQVGVFHILLDVLSLWLLYDIARRLFVRHAPVIGLFSAGFFALYPYLIFQNLTLVDTAFWLFLLHLQVWLFVLLRQQESLNRRTWGISVACGLALGVATLTRPITPPLALLMALWFLFRLSFKQTLLRLLPVALISGAVVGVWIVRNYGVFNAFVPMTTTSGSNFWQGNSEWTIPVFQAGYDVQWTAPEVTAPKESREADAERVALALAFLRENPDRIPELLWTKFLVHWSIEITPKYNPQPNEQWRLSDEGKLIITQADRSITGVTPANISYDSGLMNTVGRPVHAVYFGALLILAGLGSVIAWRLWREIAVLWFVQLSMMVMYVAFHPSTRYRAPSDPLLFVLSAVMVVAVLSLYRPSWVAWLSPKDSDTP